MSTKKVRKAGTRKTLPAQRIRPRLLAADALLSPHPLADYGFLRLAADDDVAVAVIQAVADTANYPAELIQLNYVLTAAPLLLDANGLRDLAASLTAYVQKTKPAESVSIAEVSAAGLQVGALITLIKKKV